MKTPREITDDSKLYKEIESYVSEEDKRFISESLAIANQIFSILDEKNLLQKDLAKKLNKTEAEISRWLSGSHNFTLSSIVKIEIALGERIIITPLMYKGVLSSINNTFLSQLKKIYYLQTNLELKKRHNVLIPCRNNAENFHVNAGSYYRSKRKEVSETILINSY